MSILLVLFLPVSPFSSFSSLLKRFCSSCYLIGFPFLCRFSVLVGLFISLDPDVSQNPHKNQVLLLSVDLVHHFHHLEVVDFPYPIQGCEAAQRITF
jgi:hypothetical protein